MKKILFCIVNIIYIISSLFIGIWLIFLGFDILFCDLIFKEDLILAFIRIILGSCFLIGVYNFIRIIKKRNKRQE